MCALSLLQGWVIVYVWCPFFNNVVALFLGQVPSTESQHGYIVACRDAFMYTRRCFMECLTEYCMRVVVNVSLILLCVADSCYEVNSVHILLRT